MDWQCSHCERTYTHSEFMALPHTNAVESDTDPMRQHGYVSVCVCGKPFHKGKWQLRERVGETDVSTVHLELDHSGMWYETMLFSEDAELDGYQERYATRPEAVEGHQRLVELLKSGKRWFQLS